MMQEQLPLTSLGDYTILAKLPSHPLGVSYLAQQQFLKARYWLRLLDQAQCANSDWLSALEKVAAHKTQLDHPNIVKLHGLYSAEKQRFLVCDSVLNQANEMMNLNDYLALHAENLKEEQILSYCKQVASALTYVH